MLLSDLAWTNLARSLVDVDPARLPVEEIDVLIVGSGIAGLTLAASLDPKLSFAVLAKESPDDGSTPRAQGGFAAAIAPWDNPKDHLSDTMAAGAGLCEVPAVTVLVEEAGAAVDFLEDCGVAFERSGGTLATTLEGGHGRARILHAGGDATGAELWRALASRVKPGRIYQGTFLVDLLSDSEGTIVGAIVSDSSGLRAIKAGAVVLASGGAGRLFAQTTAPPACTGDGMAAALRAGAVLADLEFVQFHPTALYFASDPRSLVSEALRGEGAILRGAHGELVTEGVHPLGDLAPRDIVARAMFARMSAEGLDHLYLDATSLGAEKLERRFPTVVAACRAAGIEPATQFIPVAPTTHYTMGGVRTDLWGASNLRGLYAVGEVASTGVHGANRLASNSLLEGVVFARRIAETLRFPLHRGGEPLSLRNPLRSFAGDLQSETGALRSKMTEEVGVVRNGDSLDRLASEFDKAALWNHKGSSVEEWELANLSALARGVVAGALRREESRGSHFRADAPQQSELWHCHQTLWRNEEGFVEISSLATGLSDSDATAPAASL